MTSPDGGIQHHMPAACPAKPKEAKREAGTRVLYVGNAISIEQSESRDLNVTWPAARIAGTG
jgi:hypothetical protein